MEARTFKTSTVIVSIGGKTKVFRSVDEVPTPMREQLDRCTTGKNAATLVIADQRGRDQVQRVLRESHHFKRRIQVAAASRSLRKRALLEKQRLRQRVLVLGTLLFFLLLVRLFLVV